jgi:hypothetical protein
VTFQPRPSSVDPHADVVLVRVAPVLLEKIATEDSEPVVIIGIDRQDDGTYDMVLRSVYDPDRVREENRRFREALQLLAEDDDPAGMLARGALGGDA